MRLTNHTINMNPIGISKLIKMLNYGYCISSDDIMSADTTNLWSDEGGTYYIIADKKNKGIFYCTWKPICMHTHKSFATQLLAEVILGQLESS